MEVEEAEVQEQQGLEQHEQEQQGLEQHEQLSDQKSQLQKLVLPFALLQNDCGGVW
jgi:hypothetical protein